MKLSPNTKSILLLTAPLVLGRQAQSAKPLTLTEYKKMTTFLLERQLEPADLTSIDVEQILEDPAQPLDKARLGILLSRGFLLGQVAERWASMGIWVTSRADAEYPNKLKNRLHSNAPPIIYGCGDISAFDSPGLAVVGSREINQDIVSYSSEIGRLAANSAVTVVSGGARGVDQAAMRGALDSDGKVIGMLADGLQESSLNRENRDHLMNGRLLLISACDPSTAFNTGLRMQRNKFIYALSETAIIVNANHGKGGTWNGALEQLTKFNFVPIYVRSTGEPSKGLEALISKGARLWPEPDTPEGLQAVMVKDTSPLWPTPEQPRLFTTETIGGHGASLDQVTAPTVLSELELSDMLPIDELFSVVRKILAREGDYVTDLQVSTQLEVSRSQARQWLDRLVDEGTWEKSKRPARYHRKL
jgi:predicted Rossmann fold nucleotide-binding protein DprA/Smf involved in DNA uptake